MGHGCVEHLLLDPAPQRQGQRRDHLQPLGVRRMASWAEDQMMNPLVPTALDGVLMAVSLLALFLALAAFISLIRARSTSGRRLLGWTLVVLFAPIIGPATWFVARHRERSIEPRNDDVGQR
ncbi:hypothetical protein DEJ17_04030 [Curtobacterium sp. MCSS17_011]|nr:hypothetical protein DEJ17_04030 [Curtobacterium sp. MCSS17_011]